MRKNRTKHEAKKPRLAKRALALCFALIFVCSCLLPVFAHSEEGLLEPSVSSEQSASSVQSTNDPVLLNEGGEDSALLTEGGEEPKPVEPEQKPAEPEQPKTEESKDSTEEPKTEGTTEESKGTTEETKNEGTTESKDSTEQQGNEQTKPEEPKTEETKPEEPKQPTTNTTGDTIEQGKATYTYRFWPDKIDAFELEAINDAVKSGTSLNDAAQSQAGMVPCTVLTVMTNANLRDYQANVQQPTKDGYEFAGWYTVDGTAEDKFSFEQSLNFEESKTIDVFAKWKKVKVEVKQVELGGKNVSVEVENAPALTVSQLSDTAAEELGKKVLDKIDWDEFNVIYMFDLEPKDSDGLAIDSAKKVTISGLNIDSSENVKVFHLGANFEEVPAEVSADGTLTFTPSSFSPFAIVTVDNSASDYSYSMMVADERAASTPDYTVEPNGTVTITGKDSSSHFDSETGTWFSHKWEVTSGRDVIAIQGASNNQKSITVKALKSSGNATVSHRFWKKSDSYYYSYYYQDTENFTVEVGDPDARIFVLLNPDGNAATNDIGEWTEMINTDANGNYSSGLYGKINVTDATWVGTGPHNIITGVQDHIISWPDGSQDASRWELSASYLNTKVYSKTLGTTTTLMSMIRENYAKTLAGLGLDEDTLNKIKTDDDYFNQYISVYLEPAKISKDNGNDPNRPNAPDYHIDCNIVIRCQDSFTAKFNVKYPGSNSYTNVYHKTYLNDMAVAQVEPGVTTKNGVTIVPQTYEYQGTTYVFDGWFKETPALKGGKDTASETRVDADEWSKAGDKYTTGYLPSNDELMNREVNFYAHYVPEDTKHDQDDPYIFVEKEVKGITQGQLPKEFCITVGDNKYNLNSSDSGIIPNSDGSGFKIRWKIDVGAGNHTVGESGHTVNGYNVEVKVNGTTVTPATNPSTSVNVVENTFTVNPGDVITTNSDRTFEFGVFGDVNHIFAASINSNNRRNIIISKEPLSVSQRASVVEALKNLNDNGSNFSQNANAGRNEFYSLKNEHRIVVGNGTITYNAGSNTVTISAKSVWNKVVGMSYSVEAGSNPEVSITNTYTLNTTSVTITKKTTGAFAERTKAFKFTVSDLNANATLEGTTVTGNNSFTLANGQSVTIKNLTVGTVFTVTEDKIDSKDYDTTADGHTKVKAGHAKSFKYQVCLDEDGKIYLQALDASGNAITGKTITGENLSITVENNFDGNPDTGVLLDTLPYLILLAVAVAGGVLVVVRKRKHRDE